MAVSFVKFCYSVTNLEGYYKCGSVKKVTVCEIQNSLFYFKDKVQLRRDKLLKRTEQDNSQS